MSWKTLDSVELQRKAREEVLEQAAYDITTWMELVNERLKNNDLNNFLVVRIEKKKKFTTG